MKKIIFFLVLISAVSNSCSKEKIVRRKQPFTLFDNVNLYGDDAAILSEDGDLLFCGFSGNTLSVFRTNKKGKEIWRKDMVMPNAVYSPGLVEIPGNGIFVFGNEHYGMDSSRVFLTKLNTAGDQLWSKHYVFHKQNFVNKIARLSDGNLMLLISGYDMEYHSILLKINLNGEQIWFKEHDEDPMLNLTGLKETSDGGFLFSGNTSTAMGYWNAVLFKTDALGNKLWDKQVDYGVGTSAHLKTDPSGDLLLAGNIYRNTPSFTIGTEYPDPGSVYVARFTIGGEEISKQEIDTDARINSCVKTDDGFLICTGQDTNHDLVVFKMDQFGEELTWLKRYKSGSESGSKILYDGKFTYVFGNSQTSAFLLRLNDRGHFR